jgi:two-component system cell cycle response regulator
VRLNISASIGVATFPAPRVESVEDLFARADAALYRAKADGRNRVRT